ncbi:MAG: hypothetical protein AB8B53_06205 [Flavobacteriales bacterium]
MTSLRKKSVALRKATLSALKAIQFMEYDVEFFNEVDGVIRASVARSPFNLGSVIEVNIRPHLSEEVQIDVKSSPTSFNLVNLGINQRIETSLRDQISQLLNQQ